MRNFHACSIVLAAVGYKQFFLFGEVPRRWKKKGKRKKKISGGELWEWGASLPELPVARWNKFLSLFFSLFSFPFCSFYSRDGLRRKGRTARNVSQPRFIWTGHATHPLQSVVWRDQVNVTPERALLLFQFSLWHSHWRRRNIDKKKCIESLAACRSWCSLSYF